MAGGGARPPAPPPKILYGHAAPGEQPPPLLPETQISSFSPKQLLNLKLISRWVGKANLAMFELAMPISNLPGLALWDTFWNMFLFWNCTNLLAATPFPAVLLLARTLGTINPVRRAWIYGHKVPG